MTDSEHQTGRPLLPVIGALLLPVAITSAYHYLTRLPGMSYTWTLDYFFFGLSMAVGSCFLIALPARWWVRVLLIAAYLTIYLGMLLVFTYHFAQWVDNPR